MATYKRVDLRIPEANLLADLTGIYADLERARDFAVRVDKLLSAKKPDMQLVESLSIAAAIAYSRPFITGVRTQLKHSDLSGLTTRQRQAHNDLRNYRDKHFSHSVNAYEHNQVRGFYCVERVATEGITAVDCGHGRVSSLSSTAVKNLAELTTLLLAHVDARREVEKARLLTIVRQMPIAEVLAAGIGGFRVLSNSPVGKRRKS